MRFIFIISTGLILFSCSYQGKDYKKDEYLDKEIALRFKSLTVGAKSGDHHTLMADSISRAINVLLLLTADIENSEASINKSNNYFSQAALQYGIEKNDFIPLTKDRPLSENIKLIKTNELNLLNKIILKENKVGKQMFTAQ